jgi:hypothetical protein
MRIAGLILGILGGLAAGLLGMKWLSDANQLKELTDFVRQTGGDTSDIDKLVTAAYVLIGAMVLGIVGGVLAFMGKGKIAAVLMLVAGILPAVFEPKALVFTFILLIGAVVSFFAKPKVVAPGY